jgi:hypothetical protein
MASVWNIKDLRPPPTLTNEIHLSDISKYIENVYSNLERWRILSVRVGFTQWRIESTVFVERRSVSQTKNLGAD